jgi:hypothetical protein
MLPSIIHNNFLDYHTLDNLGQRLLSNTNRYSDLLPNGDLRSHYYTWKFYDRQFQDLQDILLPLFQFHSNLDLIVDHSHVLDSFIPYEIHTDYRQDRMLTKLEPAYTIIIPLDTYASHTIAFEQHSKFKQVEQYFENEQPLPVELSRQISQADKNKYLSHIPDHQLNYFSIKEIFAWQKGSVYFCDRQYFHCSDNYTSLGLSGKKALVFWTSIKH